MATWKPSYSIGVPAIDAQHRELFARTDRLLLAMSEGRASEECHALLVFVRAYCRVHFAAEEGLMRERGFPGTLGHQAQHAEFNRRFEAIFKTFSEKGRTGAVVIAVKDLIAGWLVKHIALLDSQLASFLGDDSKGVHL